VSPARGRIFFKRFKKNRVEKGVDVYGKFLKLNINVNFFELTRFMNSGIDINFLIPYDIHIKTVVIGANNVFSFRSGFCCF
jgi:hypothetical protein